MPGGLVKKRLRDSGYKTGYKEELRRKAKERISNIGLSGLWTGENLIKKFESNIVTKIHVFATL